MTKCLPLFIEKIHQRRGAVSALVIASGWSRAARLTFCCTEAKDAPIRQGQSPVWRVNRQIDLGSSAEGSVARYTLPTEEIKPLRVAHSVVPHKNIIQSTSCQTEVAPRVLSFHQRLAQKVDGKVAVEAKGLAAAVGRSTGTTAHRKVIDTGVFDRNVDHRGRHVGHVIKVAHVPGGPHVVPVGVAQAQARVALADLTSSDWLCIARPG